MQKSLAPSCDFLDSLAGITLFARLDEIGVLSKAGRVHHHGHMIAVAELAGLTDVLHRNGLSADGVVGHGEHHEGDATFILAKHLFELLQRDISLERNLELGVLGLVDGDVDGLGLAALDVALGGVEVSIARNDMSFLDQVGEQHILGSTSLMGGDDILEAEETLHHFLELVERRGTGIALVAQHHGRPLAVAHGTGAGVGEAVDVHLFSLQYEYVVMGFAKPLFSLCVATLTEWLDHLDLPRFCKW